MKRLARAVLCATAAALLTAASGYQVNYGANQDINEWSTCKNVSNASPTGKAIFVPTNTSTEWSTFYTKGAAGVTITNCGCTVTAGSQSYTTAGSFTFTVPCYNTLTVEVWGGGGGGGGYSGGTAGDGGNSTWDGSTLVGNGGNNGVSTNGAGGAGGTGVGGTTNTTGTAGSAGTSSAGGAGGKGGNGGAGGGSQSSTANGKAGTAPGGGGGGGHYSTTYGGYGGGGGGGGGYATKSFSAGTYTVGASVAVVVGDKGAGANGSTEDGGAGAIGRVTITWN
jgi:hypothetical protein